MTPLSQYEAHWPEISALLDEALNLQPADHSAWIASLTGERAAHREALTALLSRRAGVETDDFLIDGPKLGVIADAPGSQLAEGTRIGAYRLISEIGRGGMGTVWLAERSDGMMKRRVALKLPRAVWGDAFAERLGREREILANLEHEHIARLYDAGLDAQGRPFMAMEFVEGEPIDTYCRAHALPVRERVELLLQVMAAVSHAHTRLVVHRDLKPANILVSTDGRVKLLDFGIAKLLEGDRTHGTALTELSGRALTPDYASPEQIRGEPLGTASDIYSLAVVIYEVMTGTRPYRLKRGGAAELEEAIASAEAPLASDSASDLRVARQLRGDLDSILNKALKKDVDKRYPTIDAFARDLRRHLEGEPVEARPDGLAYRAAKFVRRHRVQVAAVVAVGVALVAGISVALWQAREATLESARAREAKQLVLSFYAGASVDAGGTPQTTAVDFLRRVRTRLDADVATDPGLRIELLRTLGRAQESLGDLRGAIETLEQAVAHARSAPTGEGQSLLPMAETALAYVLIESGRLGEAEPMLKDALNVLEAQPRRDPESLVQAWMAQANLRAQRGDGPGALNALTTALARATTLLPRMHPMQLEVRTEKVHSQWGWDDPGARDAAAEMMQFARDTGLAVDSPPMIRARHVWLKTDPLQVDRLAALQSLEQDALRVLGANHPQMPRIWESLSFEQRRAGNVDAGVATMRRAVAADDVVHASGGPWRGAVRLRLGSALLDAAKPAEAVTVLTKGAAIMFNFDGGGDFTTLNLVTAYLALAHAEAGEPEKARRELSELSTRSPKADDLARMAQAWRRLGEADRAVPLVDRAIDGHLKLNDSVALERDRRLAAMLAIDQRRDLVSASRVLAQRYDALMAGRTALPSPEAARLALSMAKAHRLLSRSTPVAAADHHAEALRLAVAADAYWRQRDPRCVDAVESAELLAALLAAR